MVYLLTLCLRRAILLLPFSLAFRITSFLGLLAYYLLPGERQKIVLNLKRAFVNEKTDKEIKMIARGVFMNCGRSLTEVIFWHKLGIEHLRTHVNIVNPENLIRAFDGGQGVIGLTAHLGNWEYLAATIANILKIKFVVIARTLSNPWLNRLMEKTRLSMGVNFIYRGQSGLEVLRRLKRNEGLGILADQNIRGEGIYVDFFGHPAKTHKELSELILRTGAIVVPMFITRNKSLTEHTLIIDNPIIFQCTGDKEEDMKNISVVYTSVIEKYVRQNPEQWMWMHNRWEDG